MGRMWLLPFGLVSSGHNTKLLISLFLAVFKAHSMQAYAFADRTSFEKTSDKLIRSKSFIFLLNISEEELYSNITAD